MKRLAMSSDGKKVPKFDQGMLPFFFRLKGDPIQTVFCIQYVYIYILSLAAFHVTKTATDCSLGQIYWQVL